MCVDKRSIERFGLGPKPEGQCEKSSQGSRASYDADTPTLVTVMYGSVVRAGPNISSVVGVIGDPAVIAQGLIPEEVGLGGVGCVDVGEEGDVPAATVSIDGSDSCNVWVEHTGWLFTRILGHREVESFLYRRPRVGCQLINVPADVFSKTSVCLMSNGDKNPRKCLGPWRPSGMGLTIMAAKLYER